MKVVTNKAHLDARFEPIILFRFAAHLLLLGVSVPCSSQVQNAACNKALIQKATAMPLGYKLRGDRCEGMIPEDVSGTSEIQLVGFTYSRQVVNLNDPNLEQVPISWQAIPSAQVTIHAVQVEPRPLYRMDHEAKAGSDQYQWPIRTAAEAGLSISKLAFLAEAEEPIGQTFIPVTVGKSPPQQISSYRLSFLPRTSFTGFQMTLVLLDNRGVQKPDTFQRFAFPAARLSPSTEFVVPLDCDRVASGLIRLSFSSGGRTGQVMLRVPRQP